MNVATSTLSLVSAPAGMPPFAVGSIDELRHDLRHVQRRLGTELEQPDDLDVARELAHTINNLRQREYLLAAMRGAA